MKLISYAMMFTFLFAATSCLNQEEGQYIPGVNGPIINIQDGKILMTIELENVDAGIGLTMPMPKLPNSSITVGPSMGGDGSFGGTIIKVAFDLNDVNDDRFRLVDPQLLPDGRPFPFLINGSLPAIAVNTPKVKNMTFYASQKVFGFFLPIKLPADWNVSVHYRIKINGKNYGIVSLIHPDEKGEGAGVVALLTLKDIRSSKGLKKLLKKSRRNKGRLY
jgi:hypothetical protein